MEHFCVLGPELTPHVIILCNPHTLQDGYHMRLGKFPERSKVIQGASIKPDGIEFRSAHCAVTAPQGSSRKPALGVGRQEAATPAWGAGLLTPADLPAQRRFRSNVQGTSQHLRNSVCDLVTSGPSSLSPHLGTSSSC